jgi:NAD-dependent deacetylase
MTDDLQAALADVAETLGESAHTAALTGAGVSTASGIPDFRSPGGIWERFDPMDFSYSSFTSDPAAFWELRVDLREEMGVEDIEPNAAHEALATLENRGKLDALVTQNIDGLHTDAGSEPIELHGTLERAVCIDCGERIPVERAERQLDAGEPVPRCDACAGVLKPDVVLFGEQLPGQALETARRHARNAEVFLAVGSSLQVEPAASLPRIASEHGATLVLVNLESTPVSALAEYDIRADVTEVLPRLVERVS